VWSAAGGQVESRFEATFAVGLVIGLQVTLALVSLGAGWKLIGLPGRPKSSSPATGQHRRVTGAP